jgi:hypothetical protein
MIAQSRVEHLQIRSAKASAVNLPFHQNRPRSLLSSSK